MNTKPSWLVIPISLFVGACTVGSEPPPKKATAPLDSRSGSTVTGTANFVISGSMVTMTLTIAGATEGQHGVHLHDVGDCSAADATSAMGHWNPDMMMHGDPTMSPHHLGDCGNMTIAADGTGTLTIVNAWSIGTGTTNDVIGHAVIFHEKVDDLMTQMPPGNAGARQACGVIVLQ